MKRTNKLLSLFLLIAGAGLFINKENGQNKRYAGAPGDVVATGCSDPGNGCHGDAASNTGASISLTGVPSSYIAGHIYPLTLTISDPTMGASPTGTGTNAGFQIVAVNPALGANSGTTNIGTFTATTETKLTTATNGGPNRLIQKTPKALASATWTFNWTAPATGAPANIVFYYSAVVGDGDASESITDGPGDKTVMGNTAMIPVGVELISFNTTVQKGNQIQLDWKTASETDNNFFVIERKTAEMPFFQEVSKLKGHGTTTEAQAYTFTDADAEIGKINYYRLRQEDFDGKTTYSKVISVALKTALKVKVYPSVVKNGDILTVETIGSSGKTIDIDIVNMAGQVVKIDKNAAYTYGTSRDYREGAQFPISNLSSGRYIVKVRNTDKPNYASFVVQ